MFRLEKLSISGFKSFYDPAEMVFPASVTAVVGPNGCGKSNICDAITWVLGEQRASSLRGDTMEDVIFQGSERRRALSMGEVTLTLATENGHPNADDGRIVIHRRVFKSGESEYRLNGKRVRLKDIADVLMDTGLGIRNYTVMQQGKMDLILSNKPQDRRKLIEEAAGITRYKAKRRAAELKLEETQANLLRIDDTLSEVTRNLNSLKRQAAKARKHQELITELSTAKRSLYSARILLARQEEEAANAGVEESQNLESEAAALLGREEASLAEIRTRHADRAARASQVREEIARLSAQADRLQAFLEQSETNLADLDERSRSASSQIEELEREAAEQQEVLTGKTAEVESVQQERNRQREISEDLERSRQEKGEAVRQHERTITTHRENLMRTIARISDARNQVHQIEIAVEKADFYLGKLDETARRVGENVDEARERLNVAQRAVDDATENLEQTRARLGAAREEQGRLTSERDAMRDTLKSSRDAISQATYQLDSLRTLLTSLESQDEEIRKAIVDVVAHPRAAAEAVRASEGLESAFDSLLRDVTRAVLVDDAGMAIEAVRRIRERDAGRGAFIMLDFRPEAGETEMRGLASELSGDDEAAVAVRAAVPEAYLADSLENAIAQARTRPQATFVTPDGDIVRGSLVLGGRKGSSRGVFTIKRQIADLEHQLHEETQRATDFDAQLQKIEQQLIGAEEARIIAEERVREAEGTLRDRQNEKETFDSDLRRLSRELETASEERSLYESERQQLETRKGQAIQELQKLEEWERNTQQAIQEAEQALVSSRSDLEGVTEVASRARVELEAVSGRLLAVQREHENLSRIVGSLAGRVRQLREEIDMLSRRRNDTTAAVERARTELDQSLSSGREHAEQRVALEAEVADLEQEMRRLEESAVTTRESWNQRRDALFEAERRRDRARAAFELLREQVSLDLHAGIDALADVAPPESDEERERLESDVQRLTEQVEKIGPVNVLAIEEYQELETRETFLRTQRDDLVESIDSLRQTIRKINMTSRELFREAYTAINKSFDEIFQALFGGGRAAMQLLDEDDVLESGIELAAQPPGKKTQSISLLSGGERALTALALLFAIFRYKPSPFCILDEVDAPLDEVNNERFVRLVREMAQDTQFIVITHSKRTMEAADVLYGVTMEEAGCSRLVSVSFADLEN